MVPKVSIIILNWNGWEDTLECLESIYQINYNNYNVILVDNDSEDNSIQTIKEYANGEIEIKSKFFKYTHDNKPIEIMEYSQREYEELKQKEYLNLNNKVKDSKTNKLIIIKNEKNYGFAEGNNIGIKFAQKLFDPDYFLLLNNDTVVEPNFLKELVEFADTDEKIGIVGPKIYYYNNPSQLHLDKRYRNKEYPFESYISGCCFLVKKLVIKKIGMLDNDFFLFFEETDFFLRTFKKYKVMYVPTKSKVFHKFSPSVSKLMNNSIYYVAKSGVIFFRKHQKLNFIDYWAHIFINNIVLKKNIMGLKCFLTGVFKGFDMELNYDS